METAAADEAMMVRPDHMLIPPMPPVLIPAPMTPDIVKIGGVTVLG
jgi:hypothetical protein